MSTPFRPAGLTTSHLRKAIPASVKIQVILNQDGLCAASKMRLTDAQKVRFDHRPALQDRPWNPQTQDFDPPQNDPRHIEAVATAEHDIRTFGPGGERRITTRGSDLGERARSRRLSAAQEEFRARVLAKGEDDVPPQRSKRKHKIPSRPFPKGRRPLSNRRKANGGKA